MVLHRIVYFEIISQVSDTQRIAVGSSIHEIARLRNNLVVDAGENSKVLPQSASLMVGYARSSFIGMKLTALVRGSLRSNDTWIESYDTPKITTTICHLYSQRRL